MQMRNNLLKLCVSHFLRLIEIYMNIEYFLVVTFKFSYLVISGKVAEKHRSYCLYYNYSKYIEML